MTIADHVTQAKHHISYLRNYMDAVEEALCTDENEKPGGIDYPFLEDLHRERVLDHVALLMSAVSQVRKTGAGERAVQAAMI